MQTLDPTPGDSEPAGLGWGLGAGIFDIFKGPLSRVAQPSAPPHSHPHRGEGVQLGKLAYLLPYKGHL